MKCPEVKAVMHIWWKILNLRQWSIYDDWQSKMSWTWVQMFEANALQTFESNVIFHVW